VEVVASVNELVKGMQALEKTFRTMRLNADVRVLSDDEWRAFKQIEDERRKAS
jgi:hypothetical protein